MRKSKISKGVWGGFRVKFNEIFVEFKLFFFLAVSKRHISNLWWKVSAMSSPAFLLLINAAAMEEDDLERSVLLFLATIISQQETTIRVPPIFPSRIPLLRLLMLMSQQQRRAIPSGANDPHNSHRGMLEVKMCLNETTDVNARDLRLALSAPTKLTTPKCIRSHDGKLSYLDLSSRDCIACNGCDLPHELAAVLGHPSDRET